MVKLLFKWVIKSRRLRLSDHVTRMKEGRSAFKIVTGIPAGKRHLGRPGHRWEKILELTLKKLISI